MLLSAVIILMSLLFVFSVRKHKKILSALIAIETVVLIFMLVVTYLSAAGNNNVYVLIMAKAITGEITVLGISVSSLMLIQAVLVIGACVIFLYGVFRIVKEVCKSKVEVFDDFPNTDEPALTPAPIAVRKVYRLHCRMNN